MINQEVGISTAAPSLPSKEEERASDLADKRRYRATKNALAEFRLQEEKKKADCCGILKSPSYLTR